MRCIDLFAGAGGLSEGFKRAGFEVLAHVEMDPFAALTLKTREAYYYLKENNMLDIYRSYLLGNITRDNLYASIPENVLQKIICECISDETIESIFNYIDNLLVQSDENEVDVLIGGPPCQAYSTAGRGRLPDKMKKDERNYLYLQYIKFLERYQPKMFVFENVVGIFSAQGGKVLVDMKEKIDGAGYKIDVQVINASNVGVLQNRKRVIIRGVRKDITINTSDICFSDDQEQFRLRELWSDLPKLQAGESINGEVYTSLPNACCQLLNLRDTHCDILTWHTARPHNEQDLKIYKLCVETWNKEHKKLKYNELPDELKSHKNHETYLDRFNVLDYDGVAHTLVAHIAKDGHYYIHPDIDQNRSISVREAARIQSFPDNYFFEGSRTAAFTQIGNAVPPKLAEFIGNDILEKLERR
ncbi:DNA cytosine methyltransferase [Phascolarctobacterium faecium]|uniref:DNA cytosine methyltransferase n=1 Tax=Phascolarctobacterium faecium TaxID=33025 RepID=UPI00307FBDEA